MPYTSNQNEQSPEWGDTNNPAYENSGTYMEVEGKIKSQITKSIRKPPLNHIASTIPSLNISNRSREKRVWISTKPPPALEPALQCHNLHNFDTPYSGNASFLNHSICSRSCSAAKVMITIEDTARKTMWLLLLLLLLLCLLSWWLRLVLF